MRVTLLAASLGLLGGVALAQQPLPAPKEPDIRLTLSVDQVKMIVDTLPSVGCQNVAQLVVCQKVIDLLAEIRRQAKEQVK